MQKEQFKRKDRSNTGRKNKHGRDTEHNREKREDYVVWYGWMFWKAIMNTKKKKKKMFKSITVKISTLHVAPCM